MINLDLKQVPLLQNLTKPELAIVSNFLISKNYQLGDKLFNKGKIRDKVIIINNGLVAIKNNNVDDNQTIALFKKNDSLGEMSLLEKASQHQYSAEVASPNLDTLELSVYSWSSVIKKHPAIANKICHNIARIFDHRLIHANNKLAGLFMTGKIVGTYDNLDKIAEDIINIILKIIPAKKALFITFSSTTQKLQVQQSIGYQNIKKNDIFDIKNDPLLKKIIKEPTTVFITKESKNLEYSKLPYMSHSLIIVPLQIKQDILGFIILGDKINTHNFSNNNQILLQAIANQTAPAIQQIINTEFKSAKDALKNVYIEPFSKY